MSGFFGAIASWVLGVIEALGYVGIAALLAVENVFPPLPSELVLPLAGFLAGQGRLGLVWVVVAATVGSTLGALVLYGLGRWIGDEKLRAFVAGPGRWLLLRESDLDRAEEWFDQHGAWAVLLGHLVPVVRSAVSVPAGVERMNLAAFVGSTVVGSALWNGVLVMLGWWLGQNWDTVSQYAEYLQWVVLAALVAGVAWFVWQRTRGGGAHAGGE